MHPRCPPLLRLKAARERVTVAPCRATAADEVFAGYQRRYGMNRWEARLRRWHARLGTRRCAGARRRTLSQGGLAAPAQLRASLSPCRTSAPPSSARTLSDLSRFRTDEKAALLTPELCHWPGRPRLLRGLSPALRPCDRISIPQPSFIYVDLKTWLANDILVKIDRMSMASSLEVRAPLLDHHVIGSSPRRSPTSSTAAAPSKYLLGSHLEGRVPSRHRPPAEAQGFRDPAGGVAAGRAATHGAGPPSRSAGRARAPCPSRAVRAACADNEHQGDARDRLVLSSGPDGAGAVAPDVRGSAGDRGDAPRHDRVRGRVACGPSASRADPQ